MQCHVVFWVQRWDFSGEKGFAQRLGTRVSEGDLVMIIQTIRWKYVCRGGMLLGDKS